MVELLTAKKNQHRIFIKQKILHKTFLLTCLLLKLNNLFKLGLLLFSLNFSPIQGRKMSFSFDLQFIPNDASPKSFYRYCSFSVEVIATYPMRWPLSNYVRVSQLDDDYYFSVKQVKLQLPKKRKVKTELNKTFLKISKWESNCVEILLPKNFKSS